ncbi:MAG TPA: hypothetical protein DD727_00115 [Clostridiales bacterium]|nr:hypothetical protein [Clostridiales bacterium]
MHPMTLIPFELAGNIYRSAMPFNSGDRDGSLLDAYREFKIEAVVVLTDELEARAVTGLDLFYLYRQEGFQILNLPVQDYSIPDKALMKQVIGEVIHLAGEGKNLVVHCHAGIGRTGTFLACMAKEILKLDGAEAIKWIRKHIPHAVESFAQIQFVMEY